MSTQLVAPPASLSVPNPPRQRRVSRLAWLLIVMAVLLIGGAILVQALTPAENDAALPRGTSLSAAPDGTLALFRWLVTEHYDVTRVREFPFDKQGLDVLVVISPEAEDFTDADITDVTQFVESGGTVLLVTDGNDTTRLLRRDLGLNVATPKNSTLSLRNTPTGATLTQPPVRSVTLKSTVVVEPTLQNDPHFLPRIANANGATVATLTHGQGQVHIITGVYPVTNAGLSEVDNLALIQNLLAGVSPGGRIGFDEYHHGFGKGSSIADLALRSPWGWTLIYLGALLLTAFVLNGRRFGKPLPLPLTRSPAPAAYARALGNRWRERSQYAFAQAHLADDLKRAVGAVFALDPTAEDYDFLRALYAIRPDLTAECQSLLAALRDPVRKDAALVTLARRVEAFREHLR